MSGLDTDVGHTVKRFSLADHTGLIQTGFMVTRFAHTEMSLALNQAMASSAVARARYREIYGVEWSPLGEGMDLDSVQVKSSGMQTMCHTNAAHGRSKNRAK